MKIITASLLAFGLATAAEISTNDVFGDHVQSDAPATRPTTPAVETPALLNTPSFSPAPLCGIAAPHCQGSVCAQRLQQTCQASSDQLAAGLHLAAVSLVDDIDFDLYGTCDFAHLIRDADTVVQDAIAIRRALARQAPIEEVLADVRYAGTSLRHLDRSIGRRYRTRAIHFALLDAEAALENLTISLRNSAGTGTAQSVLPPGDFRPQVSDPLTDRSQWPPTVAEEARPPVPPALRSAPESLRPEAAPLVVPAPGDVSVIPDSMKGIRQLSPVDQPLAMQQRTCPVTGDLLGSMGKPIKVNINGRAVFVCCQGCVEEVRKGP